MSTTRSSSADKRSARSLAMPAQPSGALAAQTQAGLLRGVFHLLVLLRARGQRQSRHQSAGWPFEDGVDEDGWAERSLIAGHARSPRWRSNVRKLTCRCHLHRGHDGRRRWLHLRPEAALNVEGCSLAVVHRAWPSRKPGQIDRTG